MKYTIIILPLLLGLLGNAQRAIQSSFQRDGITWVSYDSKNAQVQHFYPMDSSSISVSVTVCGGMLERITNISGGPTGTLTLHFGKGKWATIEVSNSEALRHSFSTTNNIMRDKENIYCSYCCQKFPIIKKYSRLTE